MDQYHDQELDDSDIDTDSVEACSCSEVGEVLSDDSIDADDLFTVYVGVEEADPVCVKIQDLLHRGKLSKERIFYKYLNDVLEIMYDPFHEYDQEVVEFFNTITYLGGKRTACFIRGPMNLGDGRNSHVNLTDKKMNLGGPSESVCAKYQAGYTPESGVIKPLSLGHMELLKNSQAKSLIETPKLTVIPCALANDGTALKPAIEFDPRLKENIGLTTPIDIHYVQGNPSPSPDYLKDNIVTEAIVSSLTSLDNFCSLPVSVDYTKQSDCPHVGKSMKAAFSNWWLKCKGERINLALIRTLRNRSNKETKDAFRKLIPKNDHVKNKDRQDPSSVLTLSNTKLTAELKNTGYVCHTIIPELDKYSPDNRRGMFPSPISVAIPSYGWIAFLSYDVKSSSSTLYKARLHSPVDKITAIGKNLKTRDIHCADGIIFLTSDGGPIKAIPFADGAIDILSKPRKKDDFINLANRLQLPSTGTVAVIKERLKHYSTSLKSRYNQKNIKLDEVHFWNSERQPHFEAMLCADDELIYAARNDVQVIVSFQVEKDGVGLRGVNLQEIVKYGHSWRKIFSMCLCEGNIFLSHCEGISKVSLETVECTVVVQLKDQPCILTSFGSQILFSNQKRASVWKIKTDGQVEVFAGCEREEGSVDGKVKECRFRQPMGICTEFDSVIYICDAQTNSIKICTKMVECADFLKSIGQLFDAFSIHSRGASYTVKSADEVLSLVHQCKELLDSNTDEIRMSTGITTTINGPQGHVSAKTVASVALLEWGLQRLYNNLQPFNYSATNLLSCMTLDVENCHSTVHIKQANMSMLEYTRSFGLTMKEAVKRITQWAAYYHTSRKSWYPKPEETIPFSKVPTIKPLPIVDMSKANCDILRDWASAYGAAVRQRTVRQETTMAKHGTLPEFMYQRHSINSDEPINVVFEVANQDVHEAGEGSRTEEQAIDESGDELEYDESSDEDDVGASDERGNYLQGEIGSSATFLLGARSRFGRAIRFNNRLIS
ncbi:hypothetical protein OS493_028882 [Desmophyllum pertusum]|uniref:Uncharacterized protein n=1 Tax=Desmophyllum pertusum TaxID=174260 RepID=A0A9W9ZNR8_9CNID|nr:hypothetical protein OS493_028882 [Desmophyllum pertusum]